MTQNERLNELYQKYNLVQEDYFRSSQGWTILKRAGIDKIQAKAQVHIEYDVIEYTPAKSAAVKARAQNEKADIQTFGEAVYGKYPHGNVNTSYVLAMAEKRAMSRAVLKLTGFYELGVYGEEEGDFEEANDKKHVNGAAINKANNMILKGEKTAEEAIAILEEHYVVPETIKYNLKQLKAQ